MRIEEWWIDDRCRDDDPIRRRMFATDEHGRNTDKKNLILIRVLPWLMPFLVFHPSSSVFTRRRRGSHWPNSKAGRQSRGGPGGPCPAGDSGGPERYQAHRPGAHAP